MELLMTFLATEEVQAPSPGQQLVAFVFRTPDYLTSASRSRVREDIKAMFRGTPFENVPVILLEHGAEFNLVEWPPKKGANP
jgi:hypothetical protein